MSYTSFYTRRGMEERIIQIQSGIPKDPGMGELTPDGRFLSEVNAKLYAEMDFLQEVLKQSIIAFPVEVPTFKFER